MLAEIVAIQILVLTSFLLLERICPARRHKRAMGFSIVWVGVNAFAVCWANVAMWHYVDRGGIFELNIGPLAYGLFFYLIYSFVNYWYHRLKHQNAFIWHYLHRFHHSTPQMETLVAFYKHPLEYIANTVIVLLLAVIFSVPLEAVALALAIEGCLECFHHSNIRLPKKIDRLGWLIQTPKMHLIHHQYNLHRYNYVSFLWDTVFGTARISDEFSGRLGFDSSHDVLNHVLLKKS